MPGQDNLRDMGVFDADTGKAFSQSVDGAVESLTEVAVGIFVKIVDGVLVAGVYGLEEMRHVHIAM